MLRAADSLLLPSAQARQYDKHGKPPHDTAYRVDALSAYTTPTGFVKAYETTACAVPECRHAHCPRDVFATQDDGTGKVNRNNTRRYEKTNVRTQSCALGGA